MKICKIIFYCLIISFVVCCKSRQKNKSGKNNSAITNQNQFQLDSDQAYEKILLQGKLFFDPHSHRAGIVNSQAYIDLKSFNKNAKGYHPGLEEKYEFISKILRYYERENSLKNPRLSLGTKAALLCAADEIERTGILGNKEMDILLEKILSATPWTTYDSAYAVRGDISDFVLAEYDYPVCSRRDPALESPSNKCSTYAYAYAMIKELIRTKLAYVELSVNFIGGVKDSRLLRMKYVDEILEELKRVNHPLRSEFGNDFFIPIIKYILMFHTSELAVAPNDDNKYFDYSQSKRLSVEACHSKKRSFFNTINKPDKFKATLNYLSSHKNVIGFDIAGVESVCFTDRGGQNLYNLIEASLLSSKKRRTKGFSGKVLIHIHVGEGAIPIDTYSREVTNFLSRVTELQPLNENQRAICNIFSIIPRLKKIQGELLHEFFGKSNLQKVIDTIRKFYEESNYTKEEINSYLIFRLGHATHASDAQVLEIHDLGISVDINLTSNLVTGAYYLDPEEIFDVSIDLRNSENQLNYLLELLIKKDVQLGKLFTDHSFIKFMTHDVVTILGTDGGGVEHSNITDEYALAKIILKYHQLEERYENLVKNQSLHFTNIINPK